MKSHFVDHAYGLNSFGNSEATQTKKEYTHDKNFFVVNVSTIKCLLYRHDHSKEKNINARLVFLLADWRSSYSNILCFK